MKASTCMTQLQNHYYRGEIIYPRVDSDYISKDLQFGYNPHPKLARLNSFFEPLALEEYPLNQDTALLYFSNLRLITPSRVVDFEQNFLQKYFDENLKPKNNILLKNFEKTVGLYNDFVYNILEEKDNSFITKELSYYHKRRNPINFYFKFEPTPTYKKKKTESEKKSYSRLQSIKKRNEKKLLPKTITYTPVNNVYEMIDFYKRKKREMTKIINLKKEQMTEVAEYAKQLFKKIAV